MSLLGVKVLMKNVNQNSYKTITKKIMEPDARTPIKKYNMCYDTHFYAIYINMILIYHIALFLCIDTQAKTPNGYAISFMTTFILTFYGFL